MRNDLVIEGRVYIKGYLKSTSIGITDGKITGIGVFEKGDERISFGDKIILPGFVDPHVHFRDPGLTQKEDFNTGTMSALYGGVTCILDMPNTKPPVSDLKTLMEKKKAIRSKANCDYGLFAAMTKNFDAAALEPHVAGFKLFMGSTTGNILLNSDEDIKNCMFQAAKTKRRISVHAEDNNLIGNMDEKSNMDHLRNRPIEAEKSALKRLSPYKGMNINICHVSDPETFSKAKELGFTTESTLHHILFDASEPGATYKVNPPLREKATKDKLYKAFFEGLPTMIGTDHAPHTIEEKEQEYCNAPGGIPGVETTIPILMDFVRSGMMSLDDVVRMGATAPSEAFGINKGIIEVGKDADFAVFDVRNSSKINVKNLHSKAELNPYAGRNAVFPDTVMIRGELQVKDGEFCGEPIGEDIRG